MGTKACLLFLVYIFAPVSLFPVNAAEPAALAATPAVTPPNSKEKEKTFDMDKLRAELLNPEEKSDDKEKKSGYHASGSKEAILLTLKVIFYISIVAVLLYYVIRLLKKGIAGRGWSKRLGSRSIEILESASVGQNKTLNLIKIADQVMLLGVTDKEINFLTALKDDNTIKTILRNNQETASAVAMNFSRSVNGFLSRLRKENAVRPLSMAQKEAM